jgi:2-polyprenyl-3-methyl-5-hydroxy-6-metoxy-1,4-benzoquinol methylase
MAISEAFSGLLVHPIYKTPLYLRNNQLTDGEHEDVFNFKEGVPILLTSNLNASLTTTERHQEAGTQFQYKEHYQNDAEAYDYTEESENAVEREEINRLHQTILAQIPQGNVWTLDVGCGGAWLSQNLVEKKQNVISMDISDINPIKAIKKNPSAYHHALVADVFDLPFTYDSIDCIVASEIIEHVPDPKRFLAELFKVLKPGGKLIVTTPYNELIRTSLCIHCNRLTPHNAHLHSFTEKSIQKYVPKGAKNVTLKVFNSKLLVKGHIQKLLDFLPLSLWEGVDKIAIAMTAKKAYRLMIVIEK